MEVCRLRDTPIMTFINKLDREGREPIELLDEIERVLRISCAPVTWPIGMGRDLKGIYHLLEDRIYVYEAAERGRARHESRPSTGSTSPAAEEFLGDRGAALARRDRARARRHASRSIRDAVSRRQADAGVLRLGDQQFRRRGAARQLRRARARAAAARDQRAPGERRTRPRSPASCSRSRRTWIRGIATASRSCASCSGRYERGMRLFHVRLGKEVRVGDALTFMAADRQQARGGLRRRHHRPAQPRHDQHRRHVHRRRALSFTGIPNFAPEMFRRAVLRDPLRMKALQKGLVAVVRGGRDAALQAAAQQRPDPGRGRASCSSKSSRSACRTNTAWSARSRTSMSIPRAGSAATDPKKLEEFRAKAYENLARRPFRRARVSRADARQSAADARALARASASARRASITPLRPERSSMSVLRRRPVVCLGVVRLGELVVRDHGHGRLLPDLLQAVLERRHRSDGEHISSRHGQRRCECR